MSVYILCASSHTDYHSSRARPASFRHSPSLLNLRCRRRPRFPQIYWTSRRQPQIMTRKYDRPRSFPLYSLVDEDDRQGSRVGANYLLASSPKCPNHPCCIIPNHPMSPTIWPPPLLSCRSLAKPRRPKVPRNLPRISIRLVCRQSR